MSLLHVTMILSIFHGSAFSFPLTNCHIKDKDILFVIDCRHEVRDQIDFINRSVEYLQIHRNWRSLNVSYMTHEDKEPIPLEVLTANISEKASEISNQCNGTISIDNLLHATYRLAQRKKTTFQIIIIFLKIESIRGLCERQIEENLHGNKNDYRFFILNYGKSSSHHNALNGNSLSFKDNSVESSESYIHYTTSFSNLQIINLLPKICDLKCSNTALSFESQNFQKSYYHLNYTSVSHNQGAQYCKEEFNSYLISIETYEELDFLISEIVKTYLTPWNDLISLNILLGHIVGNRMWSSGNPFTFYHNLHEEDTRKCVYFNYTFNVNNILMFKYNKSLWKYLYTIDCDQALKESHIVCECHHYLPGEMDFQIKPINKPDNIFNLVYELDIEDYIHLDIDGTKCDRSIYSPDDENFFVCTKPKNPPSLYTYVHAVFLKNDSVQNCAYHCLPLYTVNSQSKLNFNYANQEPYCYSDDLYHNDTCLSEKNYLTQVIPVLKCKGNNKYSPRCIRLVNRHKCRDNTHLENCENFTCPGGFIKCPNSYCVSQSFMKYRDHICPLGQEKYIFTQKNEVCYAKKLTFKLKKICLHTRLNTFYINYFKIILCNDTCPKGFSCISNYRDKHEKIISMHTGNTQLYNISDSLLPDWRSYFYLSYFQVLEIRIPKCKIQNVDKALEQWNTEETVVLDLSNNQIRDSDNLRSLRSMKNLLYLNLSHNDYLSINQEFEFPYTLEEIDLSYTSVSSLPFNCFKTLTTLRILSLKYTKIIQFENMGLPQHFKIDILDIQGLMMSDVHVDYFKGLTVRKSLMNSDFKLCCQQIRGENISSSVCKAPKDAITSCQHIVGDKLKRISVWVVGLMTIVGNGVVLIYRVVWSREKIFQTAYGLFVTGLAVSDFLMGVYLMIIAAVDMVYADVYVVYDSRWRKSSLCSFSGFLSTLSSETSTFLIGLITLDRFISISYPFSAHATSASLKWKGFISTWVLGFVLALIPTVVPEWQIYSSNGLCLALPLSTTGSDKLLGWEFSMVVYVILNFVLFLVIAFGQVGIFVNVIKKRNQPSMRHCIDRRSQDMNIAKKLAFVAVSDFLCWFPIGIMGILSLIGQEFDKETYAWMAVFVLPVNSALNPMIYTIPVIINGIKCNI